MADIEVAPEVADIVIIGAGLSGIGAAGYVTKAFPRKKVVILEARSDIGGTWDLFRYPGVRSDSDLYTYGFDFKPWRSDHAIADGHLIKEYLQEAIDENDLRGLIRIRHEVVAADWSSEEALWTLRIGAGGDDGGTSDRIIKTPWVLGATGYYRYDKGYTPDFEGRDDFAGDVVHPQHWPEDYDYSGKRVVVIGSGATAVTLIPAMADGSGAAAHVTMLQRTPTYVMALPRVDGIALLLRRFFGAERGYALTRRKNAWLDQSLVKLLQTFPRAGRRFLRSYTKKALPAGFDVDTHFNPPYNPWDQRLCACPDGDFFTAIGEGRASVVTDRIARLTKSGILLESGRELEADLIVTATGLNMRLFGGIPQTVDGKRVVPAETVTYRGMLFSGVPNWATLLGYTKSSSWTLKVGLTSRYVVDLMRHMQTHGHDIAVPVAPQGLATEDLFDLSSGYMTRSMSEFPRQGKELPWRLLTSYRQDSKLLKEQLFDEHLHFSCRTGPRRDADGPAPKQSRARRVAAGSDTVGARS